MKKDKRAEKGNKYHSTFKSFKYTVMLFMLIPMLILGTVIIVSYSKSLHSDLEQRREAAFKTVVGDINEQFGEIQAMRRTFPYKGALRLVMTSDEDFFADRESFAKYQSAGLEVEEMFQIGNYSEKIYVWSMVNDLVMTSYDNSVYASQAQPEWYKRYLADGKLERIYSEDNCMVITKTLDDKYITGQILGVLVLDYNKRFFELDLGVNEYDCDMVVKLYSEEGEEVFSTGDTTESCTMEQDFKLANAKMKCIFGVSDEKNIDSKVNTYLIVCIISCLAIAWIVSSLCASFLYRSVKNVFAKMGSIGEPSLKLASKNAYMEDDESKNAEEKLAKLLDKMQNLQLTSLQLQINPHFVFNVLNYVNLKIQKGDETKESRILMLLSKVLGYAMSEPKYSARIVEEIKMTEKYIEIEKIKSGDSFDVIWNVDKDVLDMECIKLFLQPIVENSIMHGIKGLNDRRGRIEIAAKKIDDGVLFTISDNGKGMNADELERVRARLDESYSDSSKHIGLRNVNERIKMVYGKDYGVMIDSDKSGTKVTIQIGGGYNKVNV